MSKNHTKPRKTKTYLPSRWNYIKAWFFSRHVIKRMEGVVDEALAITPESYNNVAILIEKLQTEEIYNGILNSKYNF